MCIMWVIDKTVYMQMNDLDYYSVLTNVAFLITKTYFRDADGLSCFLLFEYLL